MVLSHAGQTHRRPQLSKFASTLSLLVWLPVLAFGANPPSGSLGPNGSPKTWVGTATGGSAADESTCVDGVTCDTFTLNITGTRVQWKHKLVQIELNWTLPATDYDMYVHKNDNDGLIVGDSGSGAPSTTESDSIDPYRTGLGLYTVHVVYFSVVPGVDQYQGRASVIARPAAGTVRAATYLRGGMRFAANRPLLCPAAVADGEPSSRCDANGNYYVSGIRGVPAGCDLWSFDLNPSSPTFDPFLRNQTYRGQPDSWTMDEAFAVGADGGGDVDLAIGFGNGPGGHPTLAFSSLVASNISTAKSENRGASFTLNPAGNITGGVAVDDRQWLEFFGANTVFICYRTLQPAIAMVQRSTDGGLTYGPATVIGEIGQVGGIDVDQVTGTVIVAGSAGKLAVGTPATPGELPTSFTIYDAAADPLGIDNIFLVPKIASDGTFYVAYSNGVSVYLKHSTDQGATWSLPVRVNDGYDTRCAVLPAIETGNAPGSIAVAWFGSAQTWNTFEADWNVFVATSMNAKDETPTFRQVQVSDHPIHSGVISVGGTLGSEDRNLLDYFQVAIDPQGALLIAYTDDHTDMNGNSYATRQVSGLSMNGNKLGPQVEGASLPPAQPYSTDGSQVVDFANDATIGLLIVAPGETALDIRSIKYSSEVGSDGKLKLWAAMKVSDLANVGPNLSWRMNFTVNAPNQGLNASGQFNNGLMARGDMFYFRASTSTDNVPFYRWGTVVRDRGGSLVHTERGTASGTFDVATDTITVKVPVEALNAFVTKGPMIASGSALCGLFGQAFTTNSSAGVLDITRGGTEYVIP